MKYLYIKKLVLILTIFLFSCSSDDEKEDIVTPESIEGIWNVTNHSGYLKFDYTVIDYYNNGENKEQKHVVDDEDWNRDLIFGRNVWTFKPDKNMTIQNSDITDMKYEKYLVDTKNNLLLLYKTVNSSVPDSYKIDIFTSKKLVISVAKERQDLGNKEDIYEENTREIIGYKETYYNWARYDKIIFEKVE